MPTFNLYPRSALLFQSSPNRITLRTSYTIDDNTKLVITDDDALLFGDSVNDENGDDSNQYGTATTANGTVIGGSTRKIFSEQFYTLSAPGHPSIRLYRIEVDAPSGNGILVGYLPATPLVKGVTYTYTTTNSNNANAPNYADLSGALCLTTDALIRTSRGERPAGQLLPGDIIRTRGHGFQPVRWVGVRRFDNAALAANPKLRPIRIAAGALGNGMPERDLVVSRQHRMLISSTTAAQMFGTAEVLVAAIRLVGLPGITIDETATEVSYVHLLFDRHEVIFAEGAPTESLFTGPEALATIPAEALDEIFTIFPQLRDGKHTRKTAVHVPENRLQKQLIKRHARNGRPLLETYRAA